MQINQGWHFGLGAIDLKNRITGDFGSRIVNLPHDYMIEGDIYAAAPSGAVSGYYNAGVAWYEKDIDIPAEWRDDQTFLRFDGAMMNATIKLKGGCLHHDNGVIGTVSLYDAEARKVKKRKEAGFNAIRITHNPPSAALIEACDRLGMYVFDEAFANGLDIVDCIIL